MSESINKLLTEYGREKEFAGDTEANALLKDIRNTPHAFVLGCLMDKAIPAERAWAIPYKISKVLGSFSMDALKKHNLAQWTALFNKHTWHFYNNDMAKVFCCGVRDIDKKYGGDASRIWSGNPSSNDVVLRFRQFHGAGPKISTMAANILWRYFQVPMSDLSAIDISVDTHVRRVMPRIGLVPKDATDAMIISKAQEMNREYPGIIDFACWDIGRTWCHENNPDCPNCPVRTDCATGKKSV